MQKQSTQRVTRRQKRTFILIRQYKTSIFQNTPPPRFFFFSSFFFSINEQTIKDYQTVIFNILCLVVAYDSMRLFSWHLHYTCREWGWGVEGKQVGSMDEESQVRGCYKITFICTPTNQETVSVLEKTQANKTFRT